MQSDTKKDIGIFGSAFNPAHYGHLNVLQQASERYRIILVTPSFRHAFGKQMARYELRLDMAKALVHEGEWGGTEVVASDIERHLAAGDSERPVFTYDVLAHVEQAFSTDSIEFIMGPDNASPDVLSRFYRYEELQSRWGIFEAKELKPIRSTKIRQGYSEQNHYDPVELPASVKDIIRNNRLYREN